MDERERKKQELLDELARRFRESQDALKEIASQAHKSMKQRKAPAGVPFTALEFIEFTNAEEFRKFREEKQITDDDLNNLDMEELCRKLLEGEDT
jgi:hypothetical protein